MIEVAITMLAIFLLALVHLQQGIDADPLVAHSGYYDTPDDSHRPYHGG